MRNPNLILKSRVSRYLAISLKYLLRDYGKIQISSIPILTGRLNPDFVIKEKIGIVFQGPIASKEGAEFLFENLQELKRKIPDLVFVVSTWDKAREFLVNFPDDFPVIFSDETRFESNFEKQVNSTSIGISHLKSQNCTFVFKIRVDQSFNFEVLINTSLSNFARWSSSDKQIGFATMNTYSHRLLGFSDMITFGKVNGMANFWDPNFSDIRFRLNMKIDLEYPSWVNGVEAHWYEAWLNIRYATRNNFIFSEDSWGDYERYLRDFTILIDSDWVNQTWIKWKSPFSGVLERVLFNPSVNAEDREMNIFEWEGVKEGWLTLPNSTFDILRNPKSY